MQSIGCHPILISGHLYMHRNSIISSYEFIIFWIILFRCSGMRLSVSHVSTCWIHDPISQLPDCTCSYDKHHSAQVDKVHVSPLADLLIYSLHFGSCRKKLATGHAVMPRMAFGGAIWSKARQAGFGKGELSGLCISDSTAKASNHSSIERENIGLVSSRCLPVCVGYLESCLVDFASSTGA